MRMPDITQHPRSFGFPPTLRISGPVDSVVPEEVRGDLVAVLNEALSNAATSWSSGRKTRIMPHFQHRPAPPTGPRVPPARAGPGREGPSGPDPGRYRRA
ncbi:hypothetical protein GCM10010123_37810 [Pilimelia anulata]|uniref:Uncharacterized protein n=1 Tax=Pilimelia anulata TaxID=53371 RepID=A0A8J3B906_9ACTN|nr:hypothetical protein GCM10010123_37810 [Pilimelia anulata]